MDRKEYSRRLEFEHELINRRVTWLLTSQTILFAAYGVALNANAPAYAPLFLKTVSITGAAVAVFVLIGILAAFAAKYCAWQDFRACGNSKEEFGVRTPITCIGFIPEFVLPLVFTTAWVFLLSKGP